MSLSGPAVRTVVEGYLTRSQGVIVDASSSVTFVELSGTRLIVDTGSQLERRILERALRAASIEPEGVTHVVNTHLHVDHCGCNDLFENARVYAHASEEPPLGVVRISGRTTLVPGIDLVPTPGHTHGSISVFVTADRRYAICGDAIPTKANYDQSLPPAINIDAKLAILSLEAIVSWAHVVVPGHGPPFEVLANK